MKHPQGQSCLTLLELPRLVLGLPVFPEDDGSSRVWITQIGELEVEARRWCTRNEDSAKPS